jgi:hypothetical protein
MITTAHHIIQDVGIRIERWIQKSDGTFSMPQTFAVDQSDDRRNNRSRCRCPMDPPKRSIPDSRKFAVLAERSGIPRPPRLCLPLKVFNRSDSSVVYCSIALICHDGAGKILLKPPPDVLGIVALRLMISCRHATSEAVTGAPGGNAVPPTTVTYGQDAGVVGLKLP